MAKPKYGKKKDKTHKKIEDINRQTQNIRDKIRELQPDGITFNAVLSGIIAAVIVEGVSLMLVSFFNVTTKEIHEIYKRVATMEDGFQEFAEKIGMKDYGFWEEKKDPDSWMKNLLKDKEIDKEVFNAYLDAMFNILNDIDNVNMPAKREAEKSWFGEMFSNFGSGPMDAIRDLANKFMPDMNILNDGLLMEGTTGGEIPSDSSDNESLNEKQNELNEEIKALLGGTINSLIDENYYRAQEKTLEMEVPPEKHSAEIQIEKINYDTAQTPTITEADAELIADKIIAKLNGEKATKTTDVVSSDGVAKLAILTNLGVDATATPHVDEVDNLATFMDNFNEVSGNLITAVEVLQKNVDPAAGEGNILPISLSEEDKIFISTQIAEKLNEEETIEPVEQPAEGVTNEELGVEVRDSKRSLKGEIGDIKAQLAVLLKLIEKKAMTFEDIYQMLARRMARDYEMQTGRRVR